MGCTVSFLPDNITVKAEVGEPLLAVAERAGVVIPTGCLIGSCSACEVEIAGEDSVRACITAVPSGRSQIIVNLLFDPTW